MMKFAAVDQGTTSTRVLVLYDDGNAHIAKSIKHAQYYPKAGWVEHDPEELLANVRSCFEAAGRCDALALTNQGESCLAWDAISGKPLSPVIVWQDKRTSDTIDAMLARGLDKIIAERSGLPLDPYFSASKLKWLLDNIEEVRTAHEAGRLRLGTTDAFLLHRLTGQCATDTTTASRTSLMNLRTGKWDEDLCAIFGVPIETLPEIRPNVGAFGSCDQGPLTAALTDQQAALYGHGCRQHGDLKITFGTGAFCLALTDDCPLDLDLADGLVPTVAWQNGNKTTFALDGGVYDVGSSIEWSIRAGIATDVNDYRAFDREPAIARGLAFVPAFSGLACPYWDRTATPIILGFTHASDFVDIRQSLLEGIVFLTCDVIDAMARSIKVDTAISIDGGLSRSPYFCQFLADVSEKTIRVAQMDEITALGAAQMAASASGINIIPNVDASCQVYEPQNVDCKVWRARFKQATEFARGWKN